MVCGRGVVVPKPCRLRDNLEVLREISRKMNLKLVYVRRAIRDRVAGTPSRINERPVDPEIAFHHGVDRKRRICQLSTLPTQALAHGWV